jgi:hypothetical protein
MKFNLKSPDLLTFFAVKLGKWVFVLFKDGQTKSPRRDRG